MNNFQEKPKIRIDSESLRGFSLELSPEFSLKLDEIRNKLFGSKRESKVNPVEDNEQGLVGERGDK